MSSRPREPIEKAIGVDDLTVKTVRDGAVCTLILSGALDFLAADEFLQHAARVLDDRIERLVLDLAGVTFLDCAGVRALAIATCFAPGGCPVIIRSLSPPARRIITILGTDEIENLRKLTTGPQPRDGLLNRVAGMRELVPVTWGASWTLRVSVNLNLPEAGRGGQHALPPLPDHHRR